MKKMLQNTLGTLVLVILVIVMIVAPPAAQAKMQESNGHGPPGGGGAGEGDPLDSNDSGNGDGSGDAIGHNRRMMPHGPGGVVFDLQASDLRLILRVDFLGEVPIFRIEIISARDLLMEANHVH